MAQIRIKNILLFILGLISMGLVLFLLWGWHSEAPHWAEVWALLTRQPLDETDTYILMQLRLPRLVLAACVGACLAISGLTLQNLFRNPLVDPFVIGVSGGGALGAGIALLFNIQLSGWFNPVPFFAFVGALGVMYMVYQN